MIENIDRVLERGERIELLVDKTDRLNQQAFRFEKSVRIAVHSPLQYQCTLPNDFNVAPVADVEEHHVLSQDPQHYHCCGHCSGKLLDLLCVSALFVADFITVLLQLIILFIVAMICGFDFKSC